MVTRELAPEQLAAIKQCMQLGRTLQKDIGELLRDFYKGGGTLKGAANAFDIELNYNVPYSTAWNAVRLAISGYDGGFGSDSYEGLISDEVERRRIGSEHKRNFGLNLFREQRGIHAQTKEERKALGRKGGSISGRQHVEEKRGIWALSEDQHKENRQLATVGRGQTPWTNEEMQKVYESAQQPEYKSGHRVATKKIAEELNRLYHDGKQVRNSDAVQGVIRRYKESLEGITCPKLDKG